MQVQTDFCALLVATIVRLADDQGHTPMNKVSDSILSAMCSDCNKGTWPKDWKDVYSEARRLHAAGRLAHAGIEIQGGLYVLLNVKGKCDDTN